MQTLPPVPTLASTALGTTCPAAKLRFEALGRGDPQGNTVRKPPVAGDTAVTFRITASAPPGTPPRPVTVSCRVESAAWRPSPCADPSTVGLPGRVSSSRAGTRLLGAPPARTEPLTSTTRSVAAGV